MIRSKISDFRIRLGLGMRSKERSSGSILMYHNVVPDDSPIFNLRTHRKVDFENQIRYLSQNYRIVRLADIKEKWDIAITFDDGLSNNYSVAAPVLELYQAPASFFITTGNIDTSKAHWNDELEWDCSKIKESVFFEHVEYKAHPQHKIFVDSAGKRLTHELKKLPLKEIESFITALKKDMSVSEKIPALYHTMSSNEIRILSENPLFSIGSHCENHVPLLQLTEPEQRAELVKSKSILEKITALEVNTIAFPDGSYDTSILQMAFEIGYKDSFGVGSGLTSGRLGLYTDSAWYNQLTRWNL
ncbi:MAG: polysaccharide deacetylase family protein [Flavobacteriales bacterium]|nr:polysaccharide deacetylase family protein [Flavobacteriales bacterium]